MKKINKNKFYKTKPRGGISLIVLVITIIVIIILTAAVIISIINNNPISEANRARYESDVANMQAVFTNTVAKVMAKNQGMISIEAESLNNVKSGVKKTEGQVRYRVDNPVDSNNSEGVIIFAIGEDNDTTYYTGKELPIYASGETTWYVDSDGLISVEVGGVTYGEGEQTKTDTPVTPPEQPEVPEEPEKDTVGEIVTGNVKEYIDANGDKAIIPIDFAIVPGKSDISKGLVISDVANDTSDVGNQFVWVPVEDMNTFVRESGYSYGKLDTYYFPKCSEPLNYNGTVASTNESEEYNKMMASVQKYKGFYMGRYEISNDGKNNAQSKKNEYPWINVVWAANITNLNGGIVEKARAMYPEKTANQGNVVSTLVYGVAWDETIRFISKNYPGIEKDSIGYGNYSKVIVETGNEPKYALNNIYDMAGNAWEWTMEAYENNRRVLRGGRAYDATGYTYPISSRYSGSYNGQEGTYGGRIQLYIK